MLVASSRRTLPGAAPDGSARLSPGRPGVPGSPLRASHAYLCSRPHWEQIRQGVTTPVADAARAPLAAACDPQLDGRTGVVIGSAGMPDDTLLGLVTPEVAAAVRRWTARLLGPVAA